LSQHLFFASAIDYAIFASPPASSSTLKDFLWYWYDHATTNTNRDPNKKRTGQKLFHPAKQKEYQ